MPARRAMVRRKDAGVAMVRLATRIHDRFPEIAGPAHGVDDRPHADRPECAVGRPRPGRDAGPVPRHRHSIGWPRFEQDLARARRRGRSGRPVRLSRSSRSRAASRVRWTPAFRTQIEAAAERHAPGMHMRMPSARRARRAVLSYRMPSGDDVHPEPRGISHHWSEDTKEEDIVLGAQVFADAAERILRPRGERHADHSSGNRCAGCSTRRIYAALALGAYRQRRGRGRFVSAPDAGAGARRACSTARSTSPGAGRCGSCRSMTAGPIAISSALARR